MSTEQEHLGSDALDDCKASRVELRESEPPADGQDQELDGGDKQEGCVIVEQGASSAIDLEMTKESVKGGLDLVLGTAKETEKKEVSVTGEKDSGGIQTELLVNKEEEQGTKKAESLDDDIECSMSLEPSHESNDDSKEPSLKAKLSDSDLVWAKVRSHPWWPGQVFEPSAASDKAKKHSKKGSFLVTYFGDCSFAWNDASKIKPFRQHFSQMAKQSSLPSFLDAVDFALEEVSRRVEFGLACSCCVSEEVYERVKAQKVINPGIREESSVVQGGDKVSSAVFFEPGKLVDYVKRLACSLDASDELLFVSQRAKLLAFNRWKGYTELPEFETLQGSVESAPKISPADTEVEKSASELKKSKQVYGKRRKTEDSTEVEQSAPEAKESGPEPKKSKQVYAKRRKSEDSVEVEESGPEPKASKQVYTKRRKTEDGDHCKLDGVFEYEDTTTTVPKKKEKTLAEFIAEKRLSKSKGKKRSHEDSVIKKPEGEKKRKLVVVHSKLPKSAKKIKTSMQTEDDSGSPVSPKSDQKKITPKKARTSFGIGASILRVANQMHCSTSTGLVSCSKKNNGSGKSPQDRRKPEALSGTPNGKANPIGSDNLQAGEPEPVRKETSCTDLVGDSKMEVRDLKGSSEEKMVNEDRKEAANTVGEMTTEDDSKLSEEKITSSDLEVKE